MSAAVVVYTKAGCAPCMMTCRVLDRLGVEYETVSLDNPFALVLVRELGYSAAPVVVAGAEHWSGFKPDKLNELPRRRAA